jgi:para-nitrobenzyl esterase
LEIGFVFDTLGKPETQALAGTHPPQALADAMHGAWVRFAATGDPGWELYGSARAVMRFDLPESSVVHAPADDELRLWAGHHRF